jgi:hypothetical protein
MLQLLCSGCAYLSVALFKQIFNEEGFKEGRAFVVLGGDQAHISKASVGHPA